MARVVLLQQDAIDRRKDRIVKSIVVLVVTALGLSVVAQVAIHLDANSLYNPALFWFAVICSSATVITICISTPFAYQEMLRSRRTAALAITSRRQVEQLFGMGDMLQSASGYSDANAVLQATAGDLLHGFGGSLHIFNNSRDRLDLSTSWNWPDPAPAETLSSSQCWALKRGKTHLNRVGPTALRCDHCGDFAILEIPMMARGEVFGLLSVIAIGDDAEDRLTAATDIAEAVADGMSMTIANITLREKLRTQALRDPLTGLYNRRYMEDALLRYSNLAQRHGRAVSAIMIDLDHFKKLNDEHGHAFGDAILREVSGVIVGALRPSDVACRYGGEELVVLLPECGHAQAVAKAERLRGQIEGLSEIHGTRISASFGVATIPETTTEAGDILAMADAALYEAKRGGRNRVHSAPRRGGPAPQLVVAAQ